MIYFMEIITRLINFNELRRKNYGNNIKYVINKSKHIANIYASRTMLKNMTIHVCVLAQKDYIIKSIIVSNSAFL